MAPLPRNIGGGINQRVRRPTHQLHRLSAGIGGEHRARENE